MDTTTCPECGAPAEVTGRDVMESTDGPVEHLRVRCARRHTFFLPAEMLARHLGPHPTRPRTAPRNGEPFTPR